MPSRCQMLFHYTNSFAAFAFTYIFTVNPAAWGNMIFVSLQNYQFSKLPANHLVHSVLTPFFKISLYFIIFRALPLSLPYGNSWISHEIRLYHCHFRHPPLAPSSLTRHLVVEPSAVRGLAADCPIHIIFKHSRYGLFHPHVVVDTALRGFQQFNGFNVDMVYIHKSSEFLIGRECVSVSF